MRLVRSIGGGERFSFSWDGPDEGFRARGWGRVRGAGCVRRRRAALARRRGTHPRLYVPCVDADRVRRAETRARPAAERRKP